jgi:hypothetical protein
MTETIRGATLTGMFNVRDLIRAWCAATGYPVADLIGRGRHGREGGWLSQGARGVNAPDAVPQDGAVLLLSTIVAPAWKDVAKEVERYANLKLVDTTVRDEVSKLSGKPETLLFPDGITLLDALTRSLEVSGSRRGYRLAQLSVDRSAVKPAAYLGMAVYEMRAAGDTHKATYMLRFEQKPGQASTEQQPDVVEANFRLGPRALNAMADLLADNLRTTHENDPSVRADGPLPSDEHSPRACRPETTTHTHAEARRERDKSQVSFESYGESSGGGPLPPMEPPDDVRPKRYG